MHCAVCVCVCECLQFELLCEDVSCVLLDGWCVVNCQSLRQPLAVYVVCGVKTQNIERTGDRAEHLKHLKHMKHVKHTALTQWWTTEGNQRVRDT